MPRLDAGNFLQDVFLWNMNFVIGRNLFSVRYPASHHHSLRDLWTINNTKQDRVLDLSPETSYSLSSLLLCIILICKNIEHLRIHLPGLAIT